MNKARQNGTQNNTPSTERTNTSRAALLDRIRALSFAVLETGLYLDGHPNCRRALTYYGRVKNDLDAAVGEYEVTYGPLSHMSVGGDETRGWQWVKQPWPWEMGYPDTPDRPQAPESAIMSTSEE